jgi:hypothetical protein
MVSYVLYIIYYLVLLILMVFIPVNPEFLLFENMTFHIGGMQQLFIVTATTTICLIGQSMFLFREVLTCGIVLIPILLTAKFKNLHLWFSWSLWSLVLKGPSFSGSSFLFYIPLHLGSFMYVGVTLWVILASKCTFFKSYLRVVCFTF